MVSLPCTFFFIHPLQLTQEKLVCFDYFFFFSFLFLETGAHAFISGTIILAIMNIVLRLLVA